MIARCILDIRNDVSSADCNKETKMAGAAPHEAEEVRVSEAFTKQKDKVCEILARADLRRDDPHVLLAPVVDIPPELAEEFDLAVREIWENATAKAASTAGVHSAASVWWGCAGCKALVYVVAAAIIAAGAALTAEAACIVTLAGWLGMSGAATLALVRGLLRTAGRSVRRLAELICEKVGCC